MDPVRHVAMICIGRAVGFAALAIVLLMLSFAFDPVLSFKCGAICTLMVAGVLTHKATFAARVLPRRTEVWLHLSDRWRPDDDRASRDFSETLRDVYAQFGRIALMVACGFFLLSMAFALAGAPSLLQMPSGS